jgi:hypothetical protein
MHILERNASMSNPTISKWRLKKGNCDIKRQFTIRVRAKIAAYTLVIKKSQWNFRVEPGFGDRERKPEIPRDLESDSMDETR